MQKKIYKVKFSKIYFFNLTFDEITSFFKKGVFVVFPSAPGLATIDRDKNYLLALRNSDIAIFDSSFFCLLILLFKFKYIKKFSGLNFITKLLKFLVDSKYQNILFVEPSNDQKKKNISYLKKIGFINKQLHYVAPIYLEDDIEDISLMRFINYSKPKYIIINIAGGTQEKLGYYIKKNLSYNANIFCLGAAIAFHSGNQAPAPISLDNFNLTWLVRIIFNPFIFLPRYLKAFYLVIIFIKNLNGLVLNEKKR